MITAIPAFNDALDAFIQATQQKINQNYANSAGVNPVFTPVLSAERGQKNVKIVSSAPGQRSVFCFVRIADGAVLKAASWKAPAKHARGSIYANHGQDAVTPYGAIYMR